MTQQQTCARMTISPNKPWHHLWAGLFTLLTTPAWGEVTTTTTYDTEDPCYHWKP